MLRGRGEGEGPHGHSGLPRRSARHRDHRLRRGHQRPSPDRQGDRQGEDRLFGRGRCGDRLTQPARLARCPARQHHRLRHRGRGLPGPRNADGPLEGGLRARHQSAHARRRRRRRRHLRRPLGRRRLEARDGEAHGARSAGDGARQSDARNHARAGDPGASGRHDLHRALRLPQPGQQRHLLPLHLPRRARRRRERDQRADEEGGGRGDRGARARDAVRSRRPRLRRPVGAVRQDLAHSEPVRSAPDAAHRSRGRACGDGEPRRAAADRRLRRLWRCSSTDSSSARAS